MKKSPCVSQGDFFYNDIFEAVLYAATSSVASEAVFAEGATLFIRA